MILTQTSNFDLSKLCCFNKKRYPFLLESVINDANNRYSILFAYPQDKITAKHANDNFLTILNNQIIQQPGNNYDVPFSGGYFVYLSYELTAELEHSLINYMHKNNQIIAYAIFIPCAIIKDYQQNKTYIIDISNNKNRTKDILVDIKKIQKTVNNKINLTGKLNVDSDDIFIKNINSIKKYIKAGDIFQANLSRQWQYKLTNNVSSSVIYNLLKQSNPAPFAAYANLGDFSIISSSPERLFSLNNNIIQTRPIAGTYASYKLKNMLKKDLKEQAEHLMLIDLERNDLGKICRYNSIKVNEIMAIESYKFVHHIVSNIKGELKNNINFKDIIMAIFPGGTITGCPKIRSMQIISELENTYRGAYTGSLGYISNNGKMDFNILIRTIIKEKNTLNFRTGCGIVDDSIAEKELQESRYKAQGMLEIFNNTQ